MNLVSLERHDRLEYYNGKYFGKRRTEIGKNKDENCQCFM